MRANRRLVSVFTLTQVNFSPTDGKIFPGQEQGVYSHTNEK